MTFYLLLGERIIVFHKNIANSSIKRKALRKGTSGTLLFFYVMCVYFFSCFVAKRSETALVKVFFGCFVAKRSETALVFVKVCLAVS